LSKNEKIIQELKQEVENQKIETERFITELDTISVSFEESQQQNKRLLQQNSEYQDVITHLTSEQMKSAQLDSKYKEEKEALLEKIQKEEQKAKLSLETLEKSKERINLLSEQNKNSMMNLKIPIIN